MKEPQGGEQRNISTSGQGNNNNNEKETNGNQTLQLDFYFLGSDDYDEYNFRKKSKNNRDSKEMDVGLVSFIDETEEF